MTPDEYRVAWVLALIEERADVHGWRVLDLACRIGVFSTALANAGAEVLGIEGRPENISEIPLSTARYERCDVRNLSAARHGLHDVTLCLGILYHLDAEDAVGLLTAMREVTTRFAIIDTHVGEDRETATVAGQAFRGQSYPEPDGPWSSIGNDSSWWFTPDSLDDAIRAAGWTGIDHIPGPAYPGEPGDRRWLVIS